MHILFFADNFPPEGNAIASRVYERACYWVKWGHMVTVITSAPNFPEGKLYPGYKNKYYQVEMMNGIRVVRVKTFIFKNQGLILRFLDFLSYMLPAFLASFKQKDIDVIAATTPQPFAALTAFAVAKFKRCPFVLEVADIWPASIIGVGAMRKNIAIRLLEKLELFLYAQADQIVVLTSAFEKNLVARGVAPEKITVVVNGVELSQYTPRAPATKLYAQYQIPAEKCLIGYLGTHGMAHALSNVLLAAEKLKADTDIHFLFVGAGAEREKLIKLAANLKLTNVQFIPAQPKNLMADWWSICDIALIHLKNDPTFAEVLPSKIFEAMGMGLPIVLAAPKGVASQLVESEAAGAWCAAEDSEALAQLIARLAHDLNSRAQLSYQSAARAKDYSRERQAREMLLVLLAVAPVDATLKGEIHAG